MTKFTLTYFWIVNSQLKIDRHFSKYEYNCIMWYSMDFCQTKTRQYNVQRRERTFTCHKFNWKPSTYVTIEQLQWMKVQRKKHISFVIDFSLFPIARNLRAWREASQWRLFSIRFVEFISTYFVITKSNSFYFQFNWRLKVTLNSCSYSIFNEITSE